MDFYIRTFVCSGLGAEGVSNNYTDNKAILIGPPPSPGNGYLKLESFSEVLPATHSMYYSFYNNAVYLPNPTDYPITVTYQPVTNIDFIAEYKRVVGVSESQSPVIYYLASALTDNVGYDRKSWTAKGWTTGTQSTFEEQLCDFFYTITEQQPGNIGSLGKIEDKMNLYLYRLFLIDLNKYVEIPLFMKGNDPAYDRIYTAELVV